MTHRFLRRGRKRNSIQNGTIPKEISYGLSIISDWWTFACKLLHCAFENQAGDQAERPDVVQQKVVQRKNRFPADHRVIAYPQTRCYSTAPSVAAPFAPEPGWRTLDRAGAERSELSRAEADDPVRAVESGRCLGIWRIPALNRARAGQLMLLQGPSVMMIKRWFDNHRFNWTRLERSLHPMWSRGDLHCFEL